MTMLSHRRSSLWEKALINFSLPFFWLPKHNLKFRCFWKIDTTSVIEHWFKSAVLFQISKDYAVHNKHLISDLFLFSDLNWSFMEQPSILYMDTVGSSCKYLVNNLFLEPHGVYIKPVVLKISDSVYSSLLLEWMYLGASIAPLPFYFMNTYTASI